MIRAAVIGGGSWGTALAHALRCGTAMPTLLVRNQDSAALLADGRCRQLADLPAVDGFDATTNPEILSTAEMTLVVVPVAATRASLSLIAAHAPTMAPVVLCAKGLVMDGDTPMLVSELAAQMLPDTPHVILSGPTFADEVMQGLPAAITAASTDRQAIDTVQQAFAGSHLRVYGNLDPIGVAIGGAMKNVIAIAAGCAAGLGLGDNARAALITRGLAEMARFAVAAGAQPDTIYGLSGAGDLALTCAGPHSRNMAYGLALGRGETPSDRLAEGRHSVAALAARGIELGVELPITMGVDSVINQDADLRQVVASLLARRVGVE
ncbi:NAD(P)H-dependent glycerol-3-phosphate dehydrogenase [Alphaproteobacteria bacterium LSUCC0719]